MFAIKSFVLLVLIIDGIPSSLGFQSRTRIKDHVASHSAALLVTSSINPKYEKKSNARATTSVSYRSPQGQEWIEKSIEYYTTVMRKEEGTLSATSRDKQSRIAKRLYHAIQQVRSGNLSRAENIYRKTIQDINKEDNCSNAELATTTLLLALVLQRMGNTEEARMVFHRFFCTAMSTAENDPFHERVCTGKVLRVYVSFEMKFGSNRRSIELARRASQFDGGLSKVFDWKHFRDAKEKIPRSPGNNHTHRATSCSFVAEVNLPADTGDFRLRAYRVSRDVPNKKLTFTETEPSVIYYAGKPPLRTNAKNMNDVPIRIHSLSAKCDISEIERCKYKEQLELSMQHVREHGGAIIYFEPVSQNNSFVNGVAASVLQKNGIETINDDIQLGADSQYSVIPSLLDDMGIESIRLVSNSPSMVRMLQELGVDVRGTVPLVAKGNDSRKGCHGVEFSPRAT